MSGGRAGGSCCAVLCSGRQAWNGCNCLKVGIGTFREIAQVLLATVRDEGKFGAHLLVPHPADPFE